MTVAQGSYTFSSSKGDVIIMPPFSPWPGWLASLRFFQRAPPTSDSPAFLAFAFTGRAIDEIALRFLSWPTRKGWLAGEGAAPACQNGIPHRQTLAHSHPNNTVHRALDMAASLITFLQNPESILGNSREGRLTITDDYGQNYSLL
jgi:hypothetical protein